MSTQEKLLKLFLLDQQVRGMRSRLGAATRRRQAQETRLAQLRQQHRELSDQLRHEQASSAGLEHESRDMDQRIDSLRERMNNVTNNREYSALLIEVDTLKAEKSKLEDQALEQMSKAEQTTAELAGLASRITDQEKLVAQAEREVSRSEAEVGDELDALAQQRDAAAAEIPGDVRATFERTADVHDGETMAAVVEASRRHMEYTCGGCFMAIPFESVNAVISRPDEVVICPSCGRILHIDATLKSEMVPKT